jgi:hypothetical protein
MSTYGLDPCNEFFAPSRRGKMEAALKHLTNDSTPPCYKLKKWEVEKAHQRIHAASILRKATGAELARV